MRKVNYFFIWQMLILLTLNSCDNSSDVAYEKWNAKNYLDFGLHKLISDSLINSMEAIQLLKKSYYILYADSKEDFPPGSEDIAYSYFKVGDKPGFIEYSKCLGHNLTPKEGFIPKQYYTFNWNNNQIFPDSSCYFAFKYLNQEEVKTSIIFPKSFGNLRSDVSNLDITKGSNLIWDNPGQEEIALYAQLTFTKPDGKIPGKSKLEYVGLIENLGNLEITPHLLQRIGADSLCINILFTLIKANYKIDNFDNIDKQVITIGYIENSISISCNWK